MLKYIGGGKFLKGVPARDLTDEEAARLGVKRLTDSGLYIRPAAKMAKAKKSEPEHETREEVSL